MTPELFAFLATLPAGYEVILHPDASRAGIRVDLFGWSRGHVERAVFRSTVDSPDVLLAKLKEMRYELDRQLQAA